MAFWTVDLTTEDGALSAAQTGGFACLLAAGLTVIGFLLVSMAFAGSATPGPAFVAAAITAGLEVLVFAIAFVRLRAGKGLIWGGAAAVLLVLEIVGRLIALTGIPGIVIDAILLIGVINGMRGARALGRRGLSADEAAEVFN